MDITTTLSTTRIKKICKKVGIKNVNSLVPEEVRGEMNKFLEQFLRRIITVTQYFDKQTISVNHIYLATNNFLLLGDKKIPRCNDNKKKICLEFSKSSFKGLIKQTINDEQYGKPKDILKNSKFSYNNPVIGDDASQLIQYYTEQYITKILEEAKLVMKNSGRHTLYPRDIQLTIKISGDIKE